MNMYTTASDIPMTHSAHKVHRRRAARSFGFHRFIVFLVFTLMIAFLCGITFGSILSSAKTADEKALDTFKYYKNITVESGDSLWQIASEHITDDYDSMEQYIEEVCVINHLDSAQILAGSSLTVPYYSSEFK